MFSEYTYLNTSFTCKITTDGIWRRFPGSKFISFMMFDNLTGISWRRKLKDFCSVSFRPNSMNCCMVRGLGLYSEYLSSKFCDFVSSILLRFLKPWVNLILTSVDLFSRKLKLVFWNYLLSCFRVFTFSNSCIITWFSNYL